MDDAVQYSAEAYKHVPRHTLQSINAAAACLHRQGLPPVEKNKLG